MTLNSILAQINSDLGSAYDPNATLTQNELTAITDIIAVSLETVNPDRTYPSTPIH